MRRVAKQEVKCKVTCRRPSLSCIAVCESFMRLKMEPKMSAAETLAMVRAMMVALSLEICLQDLFNSSCACTHDVHISSLTHSMTLSLETQQNRSTSLSGLIWNGEAFQKCPTNTKPQIVLRCSGP